MTILSYRHLPPLLYFLKCQLQAASGFQLGGLRRHCHTQLGQNGTAQRICCGEDHPPQELQPQESRQ